MMRSQAHIGLLLALPFMASACAAPVTAVRVDAKVVQRELTGNVLTTGEPSRFTRNQLFIHGLDVAFGEKPEETLEQFRKIILAGQAGPGELCAAAELSFLHAEATGNPAYYLAAAVYAWMFLFPDEKGAPLEPFDPRVRMAADLYNRSITLALASDDGAEVDLRSGTYLLPWGDLEVEFDKTQLRSRRQFQAECRVQIPIRRGGPSPYDILDQLTIRFLVQKPAANVDPRLGIKQPDRVRVGCGLRRNRRLAQLRFDHAARDCFRTWQAACDSSYPNQRYQETESKPLSH